jgi:exodeoxyribonuclease V alpha subunit
LGDEDQLASVEAGAVLGDICNSGAPRSYSCAFVESIAAFTGDRLKSLAPNAGVKNQSSPSGRAPSPDLSLRERNPTSQLSTQGPPGTTGIWDCIVQLTRSYRYGADSGIGALARAINVGDSDAALSILDSSDYPDVTLVAPATDGRLSAALHDAVVRGFAPYLCEGDPAGRLRAFERFRVLCAHRRGWDGVEWVNRQIEAALAAAGMIPHDGHLYVGQPIIVTRNDYQLGLFNGDVGLIVPDPERADARVAVFIAPDGTPRTVSLARLPPHETVFAMSVHKSQGSEFDEVAVLLPQQVSPVVSRELLYTAVTRARRKVTIHAAREVVADAITHRIERASGLREMLWR